MNKISVALPTANLPERVGQRGISSEPVVFQQQSRDLMAQLLNCACAVQSLRSEVPAATDQKLSAALSDKAVVANGKAYAQCNSLLLKFAFPLVWKKDLSAIFPFKKRAHLFSFLSPGGTQPVQEWYSQAHKLMQKVCSEKTLLVFKHLCAKQQPRNPQISGAESSGANKRLPLYNHLQWFCLWKNLACKNKAVLLRPKGYYASMAVAEAA